MMFTRVLVAALIAAIALSVAPVVGDEPPPTAEPTPALPSAVPPADVFSAERLDQIVSPVALYPDSLLIQILMASTYPLEVIEAERWMKKNPDLKGDELDKALVPSGVRADLQLHRRVWRTTPDRLLPRRVCLPTWVCGDGELALIWCGYGGRCCAVGRV
jgi:hypothetical protein